MATESTSDIKDMISGSAPFDLTKKKKKKKNVVIADDSVSQLAEETESLSIKDGVESQFFGMKKKKKKPIEAGSLIEGSSLLAEDVDEDVGNEVSKVVQNKQFPWEGSDRDYLYEELLGRVFNILRENNPELSGDRRRTVMRPPEILREGTKKTVFANFKDLCKTMHRQPDHVQAFLLSELGTTGSQDGQQRLVVKGRFTPKHFEGILRRYMNEYVICLGCKSSDTVLSKKNRLIFLKCEKCFSGRSVVPIKAGYVARVGRRSSGA